MFASRNGPANLPYVSWMKRAGAAYCGGIPVESDSMNACSASTTFSGPRSFNCRRSIEHLPGRQVMDYLSSGLPTLAPQPASATQASPQRREQQEQELLRPDILRSKK